jgi:hypothetical protein
MRTTIVRTHTHMTRARRGAFIRSLPVRRCQLRRLPLRRASLNKSVAAGRRGTCARACPSYLGTTARGTPFRGYNCARNAVPRLQLRAERRSAATRTSRFLGVFVSWWPSIAARPRRSVALHAAVGGIAGTAPRPQIRVHLRASVAKNAAVAIFESKRKGRP